jgi:hypothetical protein
VRGRNIPDYLIAEQARLVEAMAEAGGPVKSSGLARILYGEKPPRSAMARVTQRLRSLERDGIVIRGGDRVRGFDWCLKA